MSNSSPVTETIAAADAPGQWNALLTKVGQHATRVIVEEGGVPIAALISAEDLARFTRLERERRHDFGVLDELRAAFRDVSPEEVEAEADRAISRSRGAA